MRIDDIMSQPVATIAPQASADQAWQAMRQQSIHHLVVCEKGDKVIGVVSRGDLGGEHGATIRKNKKVADVMTSPVATIEASATVREAANKLRGRFIGSLPVVRKGRLVGIITTTDLLELIGRGVQRPVEVRERPTLNRKQSRATVTAHRR